jgi:hypothetical protein
MSWYFKSCGKKKDVAGVVLADKSLPVALINAIAEPIVTTGGNRLKLGDDGFDSVRIETSGHGASFTLTMEEFNAAVDPTPAPMPAPTASPPS